MNKLVRLVDGRTRLLYAKIFEGIEREFPNVINNGKWEKLRKDILDLANDIARGNREDLDQLDFKYKNFPMVLHCNAQGKKNISFAINALDIIQRMFFLEDPFRIILVEQENNYTVEVIKCLRKIFDVGDIHFKIDAKTKKNFVIYNIKAEDCTKIICVLDMIPFRQEKAMQYKQWKEKLSAWHFKYGEW